VNGRLEEMTTQERRHELHKTVVVVMGVAGSGKSTIAQLLAQQLGWTSIEGDDIHPRRTLPRWRLEHRCPMPSENHGCARYPSESTRQKATR
jgi:cytidylate kinase